MHAVCLNLCTNVGANNIKVGGDRKMAPREVARRGNRRLTDVPRYWNFSSRRQPKLSRIIIGRAVNLCIRCLTKCLPRKVFPKVFNATQEVHVTTFQLFSFERSAYLFTRESIREN